MLIGQRVCNTETMFDLVKKVEYENISTNLFREVVSFLNWYASI